ncbi:hypothetical protein SNEBB_011213 [Seison nebaliae]|nr:hypothetical protein SNEBB_011213 [Seison nebaliae]
MRNKIDEFVESQLELINFERDAAITAQCELFRKATKKLLKNEGLLIDHLKFSSFISTRSIKTSIAIEKVNESEDSNDNFSVGDCVVLVPKFENISQINNILFNEENEEKNNIKICYELAILTKQKNGIYFELELSGEDPTEMNWIEKCSNLLMIKIVNDVPYKRCKKTMNHLKKLDELKFSFLFQNELFPAKDSQWKVDKSQQLNEYQLEIVGSCVNSNNSKIQIIHGPPGTGKTRTLVHILKNLVEANPSTLILASAPSNVAVDNLMLQFIQLTSPTIKRKNKRRSIKFFRIGHPSRSFVELSPYNLNNLVNSNKSTDNEVIKDLKNEIKNEKNFRVRGKLFGELRKYLRKANEILFDNTQIIFGTTSSFGSEMIIKQLNRIREHISYVLIDECCQGLEADCWNVIIHGKRIILGGDHLQLSPTVLSEKVTEEKYSINLQKRLIDIYGDDSQIVHHLRIQYRMNNKIVKCPNDELYGNLMETPDDIGNRQLIKNELETNEEIVELFQSPITFIDTSHVIEGFGGNCEDEYHEVQLDNGLFNNSSYANVGECRLTVWYVKELMRCMKCKSEDIGIITPYSLQRNLLKLNFPQTDIEIKTIDGFQGREKDVIVLSLVRSNTEGNVGFSLNDHRINVAITRAAKHLCIIANASTFNRKKTSKFFSSIQTHFNEYNRSFSVNQFLHYMNDTQIQVHPFPYVRSSFTIQSEKKQKVKQEESLQRNEDRKRKLQKIIEDFIESSKREMELSNLNSYERMIVHDYCEKDKNCSIGIEVEKSELPENEEESIGIIDDQFEQNNQTINDVESEENYDEVLKNAFWGSHTLSDSTSSPSSSSEENHEEQVKVEKNVAHKTQVNEVPKKKNTKKKLNPREESIANIQVKMEKLNSSNANKDEIDEKFIKFHTDLNKTCNYKMCNTRIHLIQKHCTFCDGRYCLNHGMEEVHGCGDKLKEKLLQEKNSNIFFNQKNDKKTKRKNKILFDNKLRQLKNSRQKNTKKK